MRFISWLFVLFLSVISFNSQGQFTLATELLPYSFNTSGAIYGCGLSAYDVDGNGWDDLTFGGSFAPLRLFLNENGVLTEHDLGLFFSNEVKAVLWADYDNDGDADLFVSQLFAPCKLYRNDGDLQLTDVTVAAGLPLEIAENWGASWSDINMDGYLDLYLCKYVNPVNGNNYQQLNHLYYNNGDGSFSDISISSGTSDGFKFSFQSVFFDYDRDNDPDLYVINDKYNRNSLYENDGNGHFADMGQSSAANIVIDAMSATAEDFDGDGFSDLYITNNNPGNVLLKNMQNSTFQNQTSLFGLEVNKTCWAALWMDANNDMFQDLYVATQSTQNGDQNAFFLNENFNFIENPMSWFDGDTSNTYASVVCDLNKDGYPDIVNSNDAPFYSGIWMNNGGDNHFISINLSGTISNKDAIGTTLELYTGGNYQYRYTQSGENYLGQNSKTEIFGLGQHVVADSLRITWPSGLEEKYFELELDSFYHFIEGQSLRLTFNNQNSLYRCINDTIEYCIDNTLELLWNNGYSGNCLQLFSDSLLWCNVTHPLGFQYPSDTLVVQSYAIPEIALDITNNRCFQSNDASVQFYSNNEVNLINAVSNDNVFIGTSWQDLSADHYSAITTSEFGCNDTIDFTITEPEELELEIICANSANNGEGWVELEIQGGTAPYQTYWNTGELIQNTTELDPGEYTVWLYDYHHCFDENSCEINRIVSVEEDENWETIIYPNPVTNILNFSGNSSDHIIYIFNIYGLLVQSYYSSENQNSIDVSYLAPGLYLLFDGNRSAYFVKSSEDR